MISLTALDHVQLIVARSPSAEKQLMMITDFTRDGDKLVLKAFEEAFGIAGQVSSNSVNFVDVGQHSIAYTANTRLAFNHAFLPEILVSFHYTDASNFIKVVSGIRRVNGPTDRKFTEQKLLRHDVQKPEFHAVTNDLIAKSLKMLRKEFADQYDEAHETLSNACEHFSSEVRTSVATMTLKSLEHFYAKFA